MQFDEAYSNFNVIGGGKNDVKLFRILGFYLNEHLTDHCSFPLRIYLDRGKKSFLERPHIL